MFTRGIPILCGSAVDVGNVPAPRPWDALVERCARDALHALSAKPRFMLLSERIAQPDLWANLQLERREQLETFLWVEPNAAALERIVDLISLICEESRWAASSIAFDDPGHPEIDLQAAETGALLAWILRRHQSKLAERDARLPGVMAAEIRRRLLAPILAHDDYPFMRGKGRFPALILSDLLIACLLMERNPARRQQPVKLLLRQLDELCAHAPSPGATYAEHLADACALADLARLLKRLTRGELDLTGACPPDAWLDAALVPWMAGELFFDPLGADMRPEISGMDLFRLGYLTRDKALCALGAQLERSEQIADRPCFSLNGRILSMEYRRAARDEQNPPPRLKRAEIARLLVSRVDDLCAALAGAGARRNAGDIALFCGNAPVLVDPGGDAHNLPLIGGCAPAQAVASVPLDADFGRDRDLMSADLTDCYAEICPLAAYQRTLITMQGDGTVRLVDAFEFTGAVHELEFRFVTPWKPEAIPGGVRLGPVDLSWDVELRPEAAQLPATSAFPNCYLLKLKLHAPPQRLICGFTFEENEASVPPADIGRN